MGDRAAYSRVYHSIIDDERFANVYDDDRALATWLRLLIVADQAWPYPAHLWAGVGRKPFAILVSAGLVEVMSGGRYRIHGLDAERGRRNREERNGGVVRAASAERGSNGRFLPSSAGPAVVTSAGDQRNQLRRDETRRDETSTSARGSLDDPYDDVVRWLASRKAWIDSPKVQTDLARLVDRKGAEAVIAAMAAVPGAEDAAQFVYGARNALFPLSGSQTVTREAREQQERAETRRRLGLEAAR